MSSENMSTWKFLLNFIRFLYQNFSEEKSSWKSLFLYMSELTEPILEAEEDNGQPKVNK